MPPFSPLPLSFWVCWLAAIWLRGWKPVKELRIPNWEERKWASPILLPLFSLFELHWSAWEEHSANVTNESLIVLLYFTRRDGRTESLHQISMLVTHSHWLVEGNAKLQQRAPVIPRNTATHCNAMNVLQCIAMHWKAYYVIHTLYSSHWIVDTVEWRQSSHLLFSAASHLFPTTLTSLPWSVALRSNSWVVWIIAEALPAIFWSRYLSQISFVWSSLQFQSPAGVWLIFTFLNLKWSTLTRKRLNTGV